MNKHTKRATSVRLTDEARRLLELLSEKMGVSQAAVLEVAIREKARKEKIE